MSRSHSRSRRDTGIELARLLACLIIVACHVYPSYMYNSTVDSSRLYLGCCFADGVAVFWMITGCFLFRSTYSKVLRNGATRVLLPLVLVSLAGLVLNCLPIPSFVPDDPSRVVWGVLHWQNVIFGLDHLWYLYVYLLVILFFPLLKWIVQWMDQKAERGLHFMAITLLLFILNDFTGNTLFHFSHYRLAGAIPAAVQMIWGHLLYRNRRFFRGWISALLSAVLFFGLNFVRLFVARSTILAEPSTNQILYWYSSIGMLCAACVVVFCMSIFPSTKKRRRAEKSGLETAILAGASYSFMIYLFHFPIERILMSYGLMYQVQNLFFSTHSSILMELAYTILMALILLVLSTALGWVVKQIIRLGRSLFSHKEAIEG